jgi:phosphoketolase
MLSRIGHDELMSGHGRRAWFVEGDEPMATALDEIVAELRTIREDALAGNRERPLWPMIVPRAP